MHKQCSRYDTQTDCGNAYNTLWNSMETLKIIKAYVIWTQIYEVSLFSVLFQTVNNSSPGLANNIYRKDMRAVFLQIILIVLILNNKYRNRYYYWFVISNICTFKLTPICIWFILTNFVVMLTINNKIYAAGSIK